MCAGEIEGEAAAEEVGRVETAEEEIGVGNSEFGTGAEADGAGVCAGRAWADTKTTGCVDPRDRTTACTDGVDVEHG